MPVCTCIAFERKERKEDNNNNNNNNNTIQIDYILRGPLVRWSRGGSSCKSCGANKRV